MNATLPPDVASALGLEVVGDQAMITVASIGEDGSVEVTTGEGEAVEEPVPPGAAAGANPVLAKLAAMGAAGGPPMDIGQGPMPPAYGA